MATAEVVRVDRGPAKVPWRQWGELMWTLTVAQLKARYRRSVLGFFWSLIVPLFQIVVIGFVFRGLLQHEIPNYTLVFLTALVPWTYFNDATLGSCPVYLRFRDVVKKIYFPRWTLPLSIVSSSFVHFLLSMTILFAVFAVVPVRPSPAFWWLIPLSVILTVMLSGLALMFAALHTYYQDVEYALTAIIRMFFFVTPVMYPTSEIPEAYRYWFLFNPMAAICEGFRSVLPHYDLPRPEHLIVAAVASIMLLGIGMAVHRRMDPQLPEVL
ncbi:MAG: ABC transporter permease [Armatimonadota bacterium]